MSEQTGSFVVSWVTDCHLNFVDVSRREAFAREMERDGPSTLLLSGDIDHGKGTQESLAWLATRLSCPIYFALGNHDYYGMSIASQRQAIRELCAKYPHLHWLVETKVTALTPDVGLIGHDGWGDGRVGDFLGSDVFLNDYLYIEELAWISPQERLQRLHALGDEAAAHVREVLPLALARFSRVFFVTHVPPFLEACVHEGKPSDANWSPHFACKAMGDALLEVMIAHPKHRLTVLCGHTHSEGYCRMLPNLEVYTGKARYSAPAVQRIFRL